MTDDQLTRARGAAAQGAALLVETTVTRAVERLLDPNERESLKARMAGLAPADGGREVADQVAAVSTSGSIAGPWSPGTPSRPFPDLRTSAVSGTPGEIRWTEHVDRDLLAGCRPVEHLLAGSSPQYQQDRHSIATWLYRT